MGVLTVRFSLIILNDSGYPGDVVEIVHFSFSFRNITHPHLSIVLEYVLEAIIYRHSSNLSYATS